MFEKYFFNFCFQFSTLDVKTNMSKNVFSKTGNKKSVKKSFVCFSGFHAYMPNKYFHAAITALMNLFLACVAT